MKLTLFSLFFLATITAISALQRVQFRLHIYNDIGGGKTAAFPIDFGVTYYNFLNPQRYGRHNPSIGIILSESRSFLFQNDPLYPQFICLPLKCQAKSETVTTFFAGQEFSGQWTEVAGVSMGLGAWSLKGQFFNVRHLDGSEASKVATLYGGVGMGIDGDYRSNFQQFDGKTFFSLFIDPSFKGGELIFGLDYEKFNSSVAPFQIKTNKSWQFETSQVRLGTEVTEERKKVIFNLGAPYIVFPKSYEEFFKGFVKKYELLRNKDSGHYHHFGKLEDLPPLEISLENSILIIKPEVYATYLSTEFSYVLALTYYDDASDISIGNVVLGRYYSAFQIEEEQPIISLYQLIDPNSTSCVGRPASFNCQDPACAGKMAYNHETHTWSCFSPQGGMTYVIPGIIIVLLVGIIFYQNRKMKTIKLSDALMDDGKVNF